MEKCKEICFDTETTGLDVLNDEMIGLAICTKEGKAWYIPFSSDQKISTNTLYDFKHIFNNKNIIKVGHNLKFDIQILNKYNIHVSEPYFDTMVAHYLLHPERRHKLDNLVENLLGYKMISIEELIGKKGKDQLNMSQVEIVKAKDYACEDADMTYRLYRILQAEIVKKGMQRLASDIEMPLIEVLTDMELTGFNINTKTLKEYEFHLDNEIKLIEKQIYTHVDEHFNIASPKQLGVVLFEKLKISSNTRMTKTKQYSTSEEVLQKLRDTHPIINLILDYRSLTKLQSTYVTTLPNLIDKNTRRIHTSFNQTITTTGRLSSINPNLQNIPIRAERGRKIRKAFIPANEDFILLSADYSQIELRLMAHISGDGHMINAFCKGEDIHRITAAKIYKVSNENVTREMRANAKTANFGIIYGISAFGLSERLQIPRAEAKDLIDSYFGNFPGVKEYMDKSIEEAKLKGYVSTLFGRIRYLPDIQSSNSVVRGIAERNAINSPIQGTAADIIKIAMIRIYKKLQNKYKTKMILQVHDELVFDVYKPELEEIKKMVKHEMENATTLNIPLVVEIGTGSNWLEAH
ncbi:DNA polymerase I [subsurface metagenome]